MAFTTAAYAPLVSGVDATKAGALATNIRTVKNRKKGALSWMKGFMKLTCLRTKLPYRDYSPPLISRF